MFEKFRALLRSRYGIDEMSRTLLIVWIAAAVINLFFRSFWLLAIELVLAIVVFYRTLSKNFAARRVENEKFLTITKKPRAFFSLRIKMLSEIGSFRYKKCPHCGAMLRFPLKKGNHSAKCPRCGDSFSFNIRF